jgi:hypothetical protein
MRTMSIMKQVVNEKEVIVMQQGKTNSWRRNAKRYESRLLHSKNLTLTKGLTLVNIELINGKDAFAIKMGKTTLFYDVASGLKPIQLY